MEVITDERVSPFFFVGSSEQAKMLVIFNLCTCKTNPVATLEINTANVKHKKVIMDNLCCRWQKGLINTIPQMPKLFMFPFSWQAVGLRRPCDCQP